MQCKRFNYCGGEDQREEFVECSNSGSGVVSNDDTNARAATIICCCPIYVNFVKAWRGKRPMGPNCGMRGVIV